jgi:hypothetical protein
VNDFESAGNVLVDAEHAPSKLHLLFIFHEFKWNGRSKLKHLKLTVSGLLNIAIHIYFIVVVLLQFDNEGLKRRVPVTVEGLHQVFCGCKPLLRAKLCKLVLAAEHNWEILSWQVIFIEDSVVVGLVPEHVVRASVKSDSTLILHLVFYFLRLSIRQKVLIKLLPEFLLHCFPKGI